MTIRTSLFLFVALALFLGLGACRKADVSSAPDAARADTEGVPIVSDGSTEDAAPPTDAAADDASVADAAVAEASGERILSATYSPGLCSPTVPGCRSYTLTLLEDGTLRGRGKPHAIDPATTTEMFRRADAVFASRCRAMPIPDASTWSIVMTTGHKRQSLWSTGRCPAQEDLAQRMNALK